MPPDNKLLKSGKSKLKNAPKIAATTMIAIMVRAKVLIPCFVATWFSTIKQVNLLVYILRKVPLISLIKDCKAIFQIRSNLNFLEIAEATTMKNMEEISTAKPMPVLFLGHGNPMNGIEENEFVAGFREIGRKLPKPKAVLCISAHWETIGTYVTAMDKPKTIHDFFGFPDELYDVQYPAPGKPDLAKEIAGFITKTVIGLDYEWGFDHGCWVVLKRIFPNADVPIVQMSLDHSKPAQFHYDLAKELSIA